MRGGDGLKVASESNVVEDVVLYQQEKDIINVITIYVETLIGIMLSATNPTDFDSHVEALDRVLTSGHYVISI